MDATDYDYHRIAAVIRYLKEHHKEQPDLETIAAQVHVSPFHFQRMFRKWVGLSPKKFVQYLSINEAKKRLLQKKTNLSEVAYDTGLSSTGRLHDMFVTIEGMTPGSFKKLGANLVINYEFGTGVFGEYIVASTDRGICFLHFFEQQTEAFVELKTAFPLARLVENQSVFHQSVKKMFQESIAIKQPLAIHIEGTAFQLKVWEALLKIPEGRLCSYGFLADNIGNSKASRAVGTAVGKNPIAFLIPCHRVIQASGVLGNYRWGENRKEIMIAWEASKTNI